MRIEMRIIFYFLALLLVIAILGRVYAAWPLYVDRIGRIADTVAYKTGKEIEKEFPYLRYAGAGGGMKDGVIQKESMIFQIRKILSKNEGIILITRILDKYLKNLYAEKKLHQYLKEHPFTYKNLEVVLIIYDSQGKDAFHPNISEFSLRTGVLCYRTLIPSEEYYYETKSRIEEPYEEAAKRLGIWKDCYLHYETLE